jgi:hypothetical protein
MVSKDSKKQIFSEGKFLNKKGFESDATIFAKIEEYPTYVSGELKIRDCFRIITLDLNFGANESQTKANVLYKIKTMEDFLKQLRTKIEKTKIK